MNMQSLSYLLRFIGILLILPSLFSRNRVYQLLPGLEAFPRLLEVLFFAGIFVFLAGAVLHFIFRRSRKNSEL